MSKRIEELEKEKENIRKVYPSYSDVYLDEITELNAQIVERKLAEKDELNFLLKIQQVLKHNVETILMLEERIKEKKNE